MGRRGGGLSLPPKKAGRFGRGHLGEEDKAAPSPEVPPVTNSRRPVDPPLTDAAALVVPAL